LDAPLVELDEDLKPIRGKMSQATLADLAKIRNGKSRMSMIENFKAYADEDEIIRIGRVLNYPIRYHIIERKAVKVES
jgi:hypothetical protein